MSTRRSLLRDEQGLSTVEYILILVLIAVVGIITWRLFGASVGQRVEDARGGITTLDGQGSPTRGAGSMGGGGGGAGGGGAGGASGAGGAGRAGGLGADDSLSGPTGQSASGTQAPAADTNMEDRDPVATQRGSLQAGEGRVTPLRSDGVPSAGDPSAGRGGGGMWKVLATIFLVILGFLAAIPLLARLRK